MPRSSSFPIVLFGLLSIAASGAAAAWPPDPCELLDDALIQDVFDLDRGVKLVRLPDSRSPQPLCRVRWIRADLPALQAEHERRLQEHAREGTTSAQRKSEPPKPARVSIHHEVALELASRRSGSAAEAAARFRRVLDDLRAGVSPTGGAAGRPHDRGLQTGVDHDVAGAGDEAAWAPGLHRLSVLSGRTVFHVTVNVHESEAVNRDRAVRLARRIIDRL